MVVFGLCAVVLRDVLAFGAAGLKSGNAVGVEGLHLVGFDLSEDLVEAVGGALGVLNVTLQLVDLLLHGGLAKVDHSGETVVLRPLDEAVEVGEVVLGILLVKAEGRADLLELGKGLLGVLKVNRGGLGLGHLGDELGSIQEEKLDVSGLGAWLVAE